MLKCTIDRLHHLAAVAAIGLLAIAPFASSIMSFRERVGLRSFEGLKENAEPGAAHSERIQYRTPSYEELVQAFEQLRSSRIELLRCAAQQGDDDVETAVLRYKEAIQGWKARIQKVIQRSYAEDARDIWYEFCAMQRSDGYGRRVYAWELDQLADESN
jgi:hypothetical protein